MSDESNSSRDVNRRSILQAVGATGAAMTGVTSFAGVTGATVPDGKEIIDIEDFGPEDIAAQFDTYASDLLKELSKKNAFTDIDPVDLATPRVASETLLDANATPGRDPGLSAIQMPVNQDGAKITHIQYTEILAPPEGVTDVKTRLSVVIVPELEKNYAILSPLDTKHFPNGDKIRILNPSVDGVHRDGAHVINEGWS